MSDESGYRDATDSLAEQKAGFWGGSAMTSPATAAPRSEPLNEPTIELPATTAPRFEPLHVPTAEVPATAAPRFEPLHVPTAEVPLNESRTQRARRLAAISWSILRQDRRLLVFPAASIVLSAVPIAVALILGAAIARGSGQTAGIVIGFLIASYGLTFVGLFCSVALACMLQRELGGMPATPADGWAAAGERIAVIASWTLLVCTVGTALRIVEQRVPLGGKIVAALAGLSWSVATMFAVPVIAYEWLGPVAMLRRSGTLVRQRWAEQIGGTAGIGLLSSAVAVPCVIVLYFGLIVGGAGGVVLVVCAAAGLLAVMVVNATIEQIFRVFVYRSVLGLDRSDSGPFPREDLEQPFGPRRTGFPQPRLIGAARLQSVAAWRTGTS